MVRALSKDNALAESIARKIDERNIINHLMATRALKGLSQKDIAEKMDCTQSRISKLESGKDDDLRIGDFHGYAEALGFQLAVLITNKGKPSITQRIKHHTSALKNIYAELSELVAGDDAMSKGAKKFVIESAGTAAKALAELVKDIVQKMPQTRNDGPAPIQIEMQQDEQEEVQGPTCGASSR
jgi:transcriptional regulator with XRE-family HTH domain